LENSTTIALSRLDAQQRAMEVISNNIANADTSGFKASRTLFSDYLSHQNRVDAPKGGRELAYTQDRATYRDGKEGSLSFTGNPLDLALSGAGYFEVATANGTRLTRSGQFGITPDGTVADESGNALLDTGGQPIQVGTSGAPVHVAGDGTISNADGTVGKIAVVDVADPNALVPEGNRLAKPGGDTAPVATPHVTQGMLENSNVRPIDELTRMIRTQREFQFTTQLVEDEAQRQQTAIDKLSQQPG
jgi:flagellar basal-body rod protein FlgF